MDDKKSNIHFYYIIGILIAIIICLITVKWGENTKLVELINFASTLTSLVLAVLAIVYAYLSNASVAQSMTSLNNASTEISTSAKDVSDASKELKGKIELIPTKLESMEGKFEKLLMANQLSSEEISRAPSEEEASAASEIVDLFVDTIVTYGWIISYCSYLSYKTKKSFDTLRVFPEPNSIPEDYVIGVLITMKAVGLINFDKRRSKLNITFMNDKLVQTIDEKFREIYEMKLRVTISFSKIKKAEAMELKEILDENVKAIEGYFA